MRIANQQSTRYGRRKGRLWRGSFSLPAPLRCRFSLKQQLAVCEAGIRRAKLRFTGEVSFGARWCPCRLPVASGGCGPIGTQSRRCASAAGCLLDFAAISVAVGIPLVASMFALGVLVPRGAARALTVVVDGRDKRLFDARDFGHWCLFRPGQAGPARGARTVGRRDCRRRAFLGPPGR